MTIRPVMHSVRKLWPDALAGIVSFALIVGLAGGNTAVSAAHRASTAAPDPQTGLLLVAAAVSLVAAFNVAFLRHLVRTYARPGRQSVPTARSTRFDNTY